MRFVVVVVFWGEGGAHPSQAVPYSAPYVPPALTPAARPSPPRPLCHPPPVLPPCPPAPAPSPAGDQGTTNLITRVLEAVGKKMETVPDHTQVVGGWGPGDVMMMCVVWLAAGSREAACGLAPSSSRGWCCLWHGAGADASRLCTPPPPPLWPLPPGQLPSARIDAVPRGAPARARARLGVGDRAEGRAPVSPPPLRGAGGGGGQRVGREVWEEPEPAQPPNPPSCSARLQGSGAPAPPHPLAHARKHHVAATQGCLHACMHPHLGEGLHVHVKQVLLLLLSSPLQPPILLRTTPTRARA